jgi:hypothetical protein
MSEAARLHNIDLFDDPSWHSEEGREDAWMAEARTKAAVAIVVLGLFALAAVVFVVTFWTGVNSIDHLFSKPIRIPIRLNG